MSPTQHSSNSRRSLPLIVGREREQALLRRSLDEMLAGQGSLALISGEAGIGKTTLVEWLASEAETNGCLVLRGSCYDLTVTPPFGPWNELIHDYHKHQRPPDDLGVLGGADQPGEIGSQEELFERVVQIFEIAAGERPSVLILEDLHWADQGSIDLLRYFAHQSGHHRILLLATHRHDELQRRHPLALMLPLLVRESAAERIDVRPLDDAGDRALIDNRYALQEADKTRLVEYLKARAEGNPLFAEELLRTLEEQSILRPKGDMWSLGDLTKATVPTLLRQLIEGRLARLGAESGLPLSHAAIIGQDVPLDLWSEITGVSQEDLLIVIEQAIEARLLDPTDRGARFSHALIREAIYESVLPVRRRKWHRLIAEALIDAPEPDLDEVAYHFQEAGDERAVGWLIKSGERAEAAYAWVTASDRFEAAVRLMRDDTNNAEMRALLLARLAALRRYADPQASLDALREARRIAVAHGNGILAAYTLLKVGMLQCYVGELREGLKAMEAGVEALDALAPAERARIDDLGLDVEVDNDRGALAGWLSGAGNFKEALTQSSRAMLKFPGNVAGSNDTSAALGDALVGMGEALLAFGEPDDALAAYRRAMDAFRMANHHAQVCWAGAGALGQVVLRYFSDDLELRRQLATESEEEAKQAGGAIARLPSRHALMPIMAVEGSWSELRHLADQLRDMVHAKQFQLMVAPSLGWVARAQGDTELAWSIVREMIPSGTDAEPGNDNYLQTLEVMRLAADLSLDANDTQQAREWLMVHDRWVDWAGASLGRTESTLLRANYHRATGDAAHARQEADDALNQARKPRQPLALIAIYRFLGLLDFEACQYDNAEAHLNESLRLAEACAAPFERALTLLRLTQLRSVQGRTDDAVALLAEVRSICEPLEAKPTLERTVCLATQISNRSIPLGEPSLPAGLTRREGEVLRLVARGLSNREIADTLFISERTAEHHVSNILGKLGYSSRAQAAVFAAEHGLSSGRPPK